MYPLLNTKGLSSLKVSTVSNVTGCTVNFVLQPDADMNNAESSDCQRHEFHISLSSSQQISCYMTIMTLFAVLVCWNEPRYCQVLLILIATTTLFYIKHNAAHGAICFPVRHCCFYLDLFLAAVFFCHKWVCCREKTLSISPSLSNSRSARRTYSVWPCTRE